METKDSLEEKAEVEDVCGECGSPEEPPLRQVRIEPTGIMENGVERADVTFESSVGFMNVVQGIIEATGEYSDLDDFIIRTLYHKAHEEVERLAKPGKVWKLMEEWGKGADPEEVGIEFAS